MSIQSRSSRARARALFVTAVVGATFAFQVPAGALEISEPTPATKGVDVEQERITAPPISREPGVSVPSTPRVASAPTSPSADRAAAPPVTPQPKMALPTDLTAPVTSSIWHCVGFTGPLCVSNHGSITAAIAAANDGETVAVGPGTYAESITVNKQISVLGWQNTFPAKDRSGPESVIDYGAVGSWGFNVTVPNVTIDGFTIDPSSGSGNGIVGGSNLQILNNRIEDNTFGVGEFGGSNVLVEGNYFVSNNRGGSASGNAIYNDLALSGLTVRNNSFTGHTSAAMVLIGTLDVEFSGNELINDNSLALFGVTGALISDNTFTSTQGSAVFLGGDDHDVHITMNTFEDGTSRVLSIPADLFGFPAASTGVTFNFNNVINNASATDLNLSAGRHVGPVNAENNYFGCATGPNTPGCDGTGGDIDTTPFLATPVDASFSSLPPVGSIDDGGDGLLNASDVTAVYVSGTYDENDSAIDSIRVMLNPNTDCSETGGTGLQNALLDSTTGTWVAGPFDISAFADGPVCARMQASDTLGNAVSGVNYSYNQPQKDTVGPIVSISLDDIDGMINAAEAATGVPVTWNVAETGPLVTVSARPVGGSAPAACTWGGLPRANTGAITAACLAALADGPIEAVVSGADAAGNTSEATDGSTLDTQAPVTPVVTINTAPINGSNVGAVSVTVGGQDGTTVALTIDDTDGGTPAVTDSFVLDSIPNAYDLSGLVDGTITASATSTDAAGNTSAAGTDDATKDTVVAAPTVTMTDPINIANQTQVEVKVVGEAGSTAAITVSDGTTELTGSATLSSTGSAMFDVTSLADGIVTATAVLTDGSGNVSDPGSASSTKDTLAPEAPIVEIDDPVALANVASVPVTVTGEDGTDASLSIDDEDPLTPPILDTFTLTSPSTRVFDLSSLTDGTLTVTVTLVDAVGNSSEPGTDTALKDTIAPAQVVIETPANAHGFATGSDVVVSGTTEPGATVTIHNHVGGAFLGDTVADGAGAWAHTISGLADGHYVLRVHATDPSGNVGPYAFRQFDIDRNVPTITAPSEGSLNPSLVNVRGLGKPGSTVEIFEGEVRLASTIVSAGGTWSAFISMTNGAHTVSARGLAGNQTASEPLSFIVDADRPTVTITTPGGTLFVPGGPATIEGTATDTAGPSGGSVARIVLTYRDIRGNIALGPTDATCTGCGTPSATWSHAPTLPTGSYSVQALAYDSAGNVSALETISFTKLG